MIGKKGGSTVVSNTVTDTARTPPETGDASVTVGGYWHHIDLSTTAFANTDIDTIEFVLVAQTSSAMNYIAVDNFTYTNFGAASVKVSSTTAVSSSPNPSTYGQSVIFTATVTRSSGANTPSGVVTFMEGTNVLGTNTLAGSGASPTATYTNALLAVGAHTITANYAGDANFNASSGSAGTAQTVNKAAATLSFGSLSQAYNGAARSVTVTTTPASLANTVTYNGSANAPTNAGSYTVIATITNPNYTGSATNTLVVSPGAATLSFGSLSQAYNGAARSVTVTTTPASLANTVTYNGFANAPTNVGSYTVIATITDPNYTGSTTNTLVVSAAAATLSFGSLSQAYDGAARSVTVTTTPASLANTVTYNGSANAPTNAGSYTVIATITNPNYTGSATNTLVVSAAAATLSFGSLSQSYNGAARSVTVTTTPASLANTVTYNGSANAPTNVGSYTVIATITNPNYTGSATNTLVVSPGAATLSFCSLSQTYNGAARSVTVATTPPGLANTVTYNGSANAPTNVGSYTVIGTITDTNYFGSATNTLIIGTASSSVAVTSSVNPSGYLGGVAFTATLPAEATGLVVFQSVAGSFSTNALSAGVATSLTITNLPRGTNVITVAYAGDGNHPASTNTFDQVVTNHPPVAQAYQLAYAAGLRLHIDLSQVATNWSDADGDPVSLTGINLVSTNGASVLTNSTQILYVNTAGVNDQIKYGISDGAGGTNTGVINIVVNPFVVGQQSPADLIVGVSQATATFYGVAGYNYVVERSTNLVAGSGWVNLSTNTAGADGVIKVTDNYLDLGAIKPASAYYRLLWQP